MKINVIFKSHTLVVEVLIQTSAVCHSSNTQVLMSIFQIVARQNGVVVILNEGGTCGPGKQSEPTFTNGTLTRIIATP